MNGAFQPSAPTVKLATKATEIIGRNWLTARLLAHGMAVATPEIDDGIDLLVFQPVPGRGVRAVPLQLKCATTKSFSLDRKYADRGIVMAYVWNVMAEPSAYFLTYDEALEELGPKAVVSNSWTVRGYYAINQIGPTVQKRLDQYADRWDWLATRLASS